MRLPWTKPGSGSSTSTSLGFRVDREYRGEEPLCMQMSLDGILLHLSEHRGDAAVGAAVRRHTDSIEAYAETLAARELPPGVAEPFPGVAEHPWGSLDMLLVDPFGNRLVIANADFRTSSQTA